MNSRFFGPMRRAESEPKTEEAKKNIKDRTQLKNNHLNRPNSNFDEFFPGLKCSEEKKQLLSFYQNIFNFQRNLSNLRNLAENNFCWDLELKLQTYEWSIGLRGVG